jgi:hypothetical protein
MSRGRCHARRTVRDLQVCHLTAATPTCRRPFPQSAGTPDLPQVPGRRSSPTAPTRCATTEVRSTGLRPWTPTSPRRSTPTRPVRQRHRGPRPRRARGMSPSVRPVKLSVRRLDRPRLIGSGGTDHITIDPYRQTGPRGAACRQRTCPHGRVPLMMRRTSSLTPVARRPTQARWHTTMASSSRPMRYSDRAPRTPHLGRRHADATASIRADPRVDHRQCPARRTSDRGQAAATIDRRGRRG